jgi:hypothetical protein
VPAASSVSAGFSHWRCRSPGPRRRLHRSHWRRKGRVVGRMETRTERCLARRPQPIFNVIISARPVRRGGVSQSSEFVEVELKPVATGEGRNAGLGAVGAAEAGRGKAACWSVDGSLRRRCISNVGRTGCNEHIDVEARRIPGNKSGGQSG